MKLNPIFEFFEPQARACAFTFGCCTDQQERTVK